MKEAELKLMFQDLERRIKINKKENDALWDEHFKLCCTPSDEYLQAIKERDDGKL
jgi:hypothetical protein